MQKQESYSKSREEKYFANFLNYLRRSDLIPNIVDHTVIVPHYYRHPDDVNLAFRMRETMLNFMSDGRPEDILDGWAIPELSALVFDGEDGVDCRFLFGKFNPNDHQNRPIFTLCEPSEAVHLYISKESRAYPQYFGRHLVKWDYKDDKFMEEGDALWRSLVKDLAHAAGRQGMDPEALSERRDYAIFELGCRAIFAPSQETMSLAPQTAADRLETRQKMIELAEMAIGKNFI